MIASIKLTGCRSGRPTFVDVQGIAAIETEKDGTSIIHMHGKEKTIAVKEDPVTVISSIQAFFKPIAEEGKEKAPDGQSSSSAGRPTA